MDANSVSNQSEAAPARRVRRAKATSTKLDYLVIDRDPSFTKVVSNFNILDYLGLVTIAGVSATVGYLSGIKPGTNPPFTVAGILIGFMGELRYAYKNSAGRFMGFFPNDGEVAGYKK